MGEWDAWEPSDPPAGFADRVLAKIEADSPASPERRAKTELREEPARGLRGGRRVAALAGIAALGAAAAVSLFPRSERVVASGDHAAITREEIAIGARAIAVMEPGAHVTWSGNEVSQSSGDVFYRVAKDDGARAFVVHTQAGDVTVLGTCFRVRVIDMKRRDVISAGAGAAAGALVMLGVYEGKVMASHGGSQALVAAGESATLDATGAHKSSDGANGNGASNANGASPSAAGADDAFLAANQNLADQVRAYKNRLQANEEEKKKLEARLRDTEAKLAHADNAGGAPSRSEFDLTQDDWKKLAAEGTIKSRFPCGWSDVTKLPDDAVSQLGLSPDDASLVWKAYRASEQRLQDTLMPLCAQVLGNADLASRLASSCDSIVANASPDRNKDVQLVSNIRAGNAPMPGPNDKLDPYARLLLAQTGAMKDFEGDLAKSVGPDEAHRIAFSDGLSMCNNINSTGPRPQLPR